MKTLITLFFLAASVSAFAIPERDLDHMDLVDLTNSLDSELNFTVQYPGLGSGQFGAEDCLALIVGKKFVKESELKRFSELVFVSDGDGILFPDGHFRKINKLEPEIMNIGRKKTLVFKLKDLGTYVTGLRISHFTVYAGFRHSVRSTFGHNVGTTAFQFLRGCGL